MGAAPSIVRAALDAPGQALSPDARAYFEPRLGHDFSRVRIHTERAAAEAARAVGAVAFTVGNDIVFGAGRYATDQSGNRLLAHELVHVVQQNGAQTLHRQAIDGGSLPPVADEEREAPGTRQTLPISISFPAVFGVTKDVASEDVPEEPPIAATRHTTAASVVDPLIVPPDHPSEREADAVSEALMSGEACGPGAITRCGLTLGRVIQRQVYWDDRRNGALTWTDYAGTAPVKDPKVPGTQWDSVTVWGFSPMSATASATMTPFPADKPEPCVDAGGTKTTKFQATARYEPTSLHVRALMMPAQSWVRASTKTASLLAHEQGHFDVARVMAGKVEKCLLDLSRASTATEVGCGQQAAVTAAAASLGRQPAGDAIHILQQACESLAEAHERGLVHRDIKPANIHLGKTGVRHDFVKVLDFGLVKSVHQTNTDDSLATAVGRTPGTPAYMAPEMSLGESIDARADIYALGCVAYYLLTAHLVFEATSAFQMIAKHLRNDPVPPSLRARVEVPPALEAVILRCLAKKPEDRYATVIELSNALAGIRLAPWTEEEAASLWKSHQPVVAASSPAASERAALAPT